MSPAPEALPNLSEDYEVSPAQIAHYQRDGHILLRDVASPDEVAVYRHYIVESVRRFNTETRPLDERDTYGKAFLQTMQLGERDDAVRRFVLARRFGKIAANLMGVEGVRLYLDQALFKEPGGGFTPWHQDQLYWPLDTDHTITMWMPLVNIPAEVGSMTFVSGSHALDYHEMTAISDLSEEILQRYVDAHDLPRSTYGALRAGDATWHAGWTMHRAPGNPTPLMREVMTIIYFADGAHVLESPSRSQEEDLQLLFPGCAPGEVATGPHTPLVYSRTRSG
jgi:ectoine hydroxylase-related dioxygenase (phytanoyl-CoA dioxygenase family)